MVEPRASGEWPREHVFCFLGLTAVAVFFFREAVFGGRVLFARDINMWWLPQVESLVRCVAASSWPVWNPWRGTGQPFLADPSSAVFYPFTWINLLLRPGTAYTLLVLLHLVGSGQGLFALARRWGASASGAFTGALIWMLSPVLAVSSTSHLAGAAWIPWVLLAGGEALSRRTLRTVAAWSLVMALQIVAGSADMVAMTWILLAVEALVFRVEWRGLLGPENRALARAAAAGFVLALGLSAAQWMPTLAIAAHSERFALSDETRTTWSLHPASLLEILLPFRWADLPLAPWAAEALVAFKDPWLTSVYLGAPALLLVCAAPLSPHRRRVLVLLALAMGALLVALGSHAPFYRLAVGLLPPLRILRYPMKAMVAGGLAWSCLAALGWDVWRRRDPAPAAWALLWPAMLSALLAGLALYLGTAGFSLWSASVLRVTDPSALAPLALRLAVGAALAAGGLAAAAARARGYAAAAAAVMAALVAASLVGLQGRYNPTALRALYDHVPEALAAVGRDARLYTYDYSVLTPLEKARGIRTAGRYALARLPEGWTPSEGLVLAVHDYLNPPTAGRWGVRGSYDLDLLGLYDRPLARLTEEIRHPAVPPELFLRWMQIGSVTHVLALHDAPAWRDLVPEATVRSLFVEPIRIFRVPKSRPEVYVTAARNAADAPAFVGTAHVALQKPDRLRVEVQADASGRVVWTQGFDRGWRATLDGRPAEVERAFVAFQAVAVTPGRHVVEWSYWPRGLTLGLVVSLASLLAVVALGARGPR